MKLTFSLLAVLALATASVHATSDEVSTQNLTPGQPFPPHTSSHSVPDQDDDQKTCSTLTVTVTHIQPTEPSPTGPTETPTATTSASSTTPLEPSSPVHTPSPPPGPAPSHPTSPPYPISSSSAHGSGSSGTAPTTTVHPTGTGVQPTRSQTPPDFTGAAAAANVPAGVVAMLGLAALML